LHDAPVTAVKFDIRGTLAEFEQARANGVAPRMFAQHEAAARNADSFRRNNFIGKRIFDDAILMDAGFMRESIGANDGFIRRDAISGNFGKQPAGGVNLRQVDRGRGAKVRLADV